MALVKSILVVLGTRMPSFELKDPDGQSFKGDELYGKKGLLVAFTCNHCPYAQAVWSRLIQLAEKARGLGINTIAINPNIHPDYPEDAPEKMREKIKEWKLKFPYLVDETQKVAKAFQAQCTPDLYLFDQKHQLVYHGRFDDNWQDASKVAKRDLQSAIENLAEGKPTCSEQYPSMGCSIKWQ